jgi:serine/threonine-protein kinase PpkA
MARIFGTGTGNPHTMGEDVRAPPFDIPGYRIMRSVGRGGMADVYLAIQLSLGRHVAIKVLAAERTPSDDLVSRFEQEARIIARLDHPHIVGIFDVGRTSTGQLYYTMPHMPNGDLSTRDLSQDQTVVIEIVRAICQALAYAHEQGIVHRDVKPENVLFDKLNRPLLADFGIALSSNVGQTRVTREGNTLGSVAYMSPEQARGKPLDGRSDIYSLGVVCYECLTGKLPFSGEDSMSVALAHVEQPVPRLPSARMHWQSFLDKAMAKRLEDRFQTAQEMLDALDSVQTRLAIILPLAAVATSLAGVPDKIDRSLNVPVRASPHGALLIVLCGVAMLIAMVVLTFRTPPPAAPTAATAKPAEESVSPARDVVVAAPPEASASVVAPTAISTVATDSTAPPSISNEAPAPELKTPAPVPQPSPLQDSEPFAQSMLSPAAGAVIHDRGGPDVILVPAKIAFGGKSYSIAQAFALGREEVTRGEYAEFVRATNRASASCRQPGRLWSALGRLSWRSPGFDQDDHHPVLCVSWDDAIAYTQWLSKRTHHRYRLPSQQEWLFAARLQTEGGGTCKYGNVADESNRSLLSLSKRFACNDGFAQSAPVGRFAANSLGIHDLLGNASEWTRDCARNVGKADACPEHVFRGLSWHDGPDNDNLELSGSAKADIGYTTVGFRVLREMQKDDSADAATATK